jgi:hypothetical protein
MELKSPIRKEPDEELERLAHEVIGALLKCIRTWGRGMLNPCMKKRFA